MGFLESILEKKKEEVKRAKERRLDFPKPPQKKEILPFESAMHKEGTKIIAEIKKASPSEGKIKEVSVVHQAKIYESAGAIAVSVLTDQTYFNGSLEDLYQVRQAIKLPLLRKDFIIDPVQIEEAKAFGADAVLLIARILDFSLLRDLIDYAYELSLTPLVEVFSLQEGEKAIKAGAKVIGINNRDLDTLKVDINLSKRLARQIRDMVARYIVAESGISQRDQIVELENLGVDAFLIGTTLMKSQDPAKKLRELLGYNDDKEVVYEKHSS